jgi:RNA polymerase sigma-70 factor (ECF subfamily)
MALMLEPATRRGRLRLDVPGVDAFAIRCVPEREARVLERAAPDIDAVADLVRRAQQRDADAFAALIRRYERMALSVAFGTLGDATDAGDAVQDGFTKAWEKIGDLKEPARFGTWLCGIIRNGAIDQRRRAKLAPKTVLNALPESSTPAAAAFAGQDVEPDPSARLETREQEQLLSAAIDELDALSRTAVILRYFEGLASRQIGEILDMNATAVDMRLSRARQQIKQRLLTSQAFSEERAQTA